MPSSDLDKCENISDAINASGRELKKQLQQGFHDPSAPSGRASAYTGGTGGAAERSMGSHLLDAFGCRRLAAEPFTHAICEVIESLRDGAGIER